MNSFLNFISSILDSIYVEAELFLNSIDFSMHPYFFLDILIVSIVFYYIYVVVRGTRAVPILTGFIILSIVSLVGRYLQLSAFNWLVNSFITMLVVAIPVLFRDEIRRALEKIGQTKLLPEKIKSEGIKKTIEMVVEACHKLSENKIGALIVIKREVNLQDYIETGITLDAHISTELLLNIFTPGAPLHDGAVIVDKDKIVAGSCVLPLSLKMRDHKYGTRHKAALGLSEQTDAIAIVVSEERKEIALANDGALTTNLEPERLERILTNILLPKKGLKDRIFGFQTKRITTKKK